MNCVNWCAIAVLLPEMKIRVHTTLEEDWPHILGWMAEEGWNLPEWELDFLQASDIVFNLTVENDGTPAGCVTAIDHGKSGWIGNLIVPRDQRGQGLGRLLFEQALHKLAGAEKVWLTASEWGAPLYASFGFHTVENIARWCWTKHEGPSRTTAGRGEQQFLASDKAAWDEDRTTLLFPLMAAGTVLQNGSTTALLQAGEKLRILGPWYTDNLCPRECREILSEVFDALQPGQILAMDTLASSPVSPMLQAVGFNCTGTTALMVRGSSFTKLPQHLTLATLGSLG